MIPKAGAVLKKIVIFGATGQVGTYVVDYFVKNAKDSFEVIASGRRQGDLSAILGCPYVHVDITRPEDFERLPQSGVYAVILLAAQLPIHPGGQDGYNQLYINTLGTYNVLEYCRRTGVDRVIFSQTNYDMKDYFDSPVPIRSDWKPSYSYTDDHAVYVISKNAAIELMEHYHQCYGIGKFVIRLPNVYAYNSYPWILKNGELRKRPLYVMIDKALAGEPLEIWGDPGYKKDMLYVWDLAQLMYCCVRTERRRGLYNAGTGMPVTLEEQVRTIAEVFNPAGKPSEIVYCPEKISDGGQIWDISDAEAEVGYHPQYPVKKLFEAIRSEMALNRYYSIHAPQNRA